MGGIMNEQKKTRIEIQSIPGVSDKERIDNIKKVINDLLKNDEIRNKLDDPDSAYKIEVDETFVAEGVTAGITIWFIGKVAGKIFDKYIWPVLEKEIDGLIRDLKSE